MRFTYWCWSHLDSLPKAQRSGYPALVDLRWQGKMWRYLVGIFLRFATNFIVPNLNAIVASGFNIIAAYDT